MNTLTDHSSVSHFIEPNAATASLTCNNESKQLKKYDTNIENIKLYNAQLLLSSDFMHAQYKVK